MRVQTPQLRMAAWLGARRLRVVVPSYVNFVVFVVFLCESCVAQDPSDRALQDASASHPDGREGSVQTFWGPLSTDQVGILQSETPPMSLRLDAGWWNGGSEGNPQPDGGGNAWGGEFSLADGTSGPTYLQLGADRHLLLPEDGPQELAGVALHINCGNWDPTSGSGAKVIALGNVNPYSPTVNAWAVNDDFTLSPVIHAVWMQCSAEAARDGFCPASSWVLAWGRFTWAPCCEECLANDQQARHMLTSPQTRPPSPSCCVSPLLRAVEHAGSWAC